jgi:hypothetical protein
MTTVTSAAVTAMTVATVVALLPLLIPPTAERYHPATTKEMLMAEADTGDLLLLAGNTPAEKRIRWWTGCSFSHVAMIIRNSEGTFVAEVDQGGNYRDGFRMMPLEEKLRGWNNRSDGLKTAGWLKIKVPLDWREVIVSLVVHVDVEADESKIAWLDPSATDDPYRDKVYCSEFIAMIIFDLGLAPRLHHPTWYSPKTIISEFKLWRPVRHFRI